MLIHLSEALKTALSHVPLLFGLWFGPTGSITYDLSGRVLKPDGQPATEAIVYVYRSGQEHDLKPHVRNRAAVGHDGAFALKRLRWDRAFHHGTRDHVIAIADGFGLACWSDPSVADTKAQAVLRLAQAATLTGVVIDECHEPVAGAEVVVHRLRFRRGPSTDWAGIGFATGTALPGLKVTTGEGGRFSVRHLPRVLDGQLSLQVCHRDLSLARRDIPLRDVAKPITILLRSGGRVEGRITHEDTGKPGDGARVAVWGPVGSPKGPSLSLSTTAGSDGRYAIARLPEGEYALRVLPQPDADWAPPPRTSVSVTAGQTTRESDLVLLKGQVIRGHVTDAASGEGVPRTEVRANGRPGEYRAVTGDDGAFGIRCAPGTYRVRVATAPPGYAQPSWREQSKVTVLSAEDVRDVELKLSKGLTIVGKVVDSQGELVPRAKLCPFQEFGYYVAATADDRGVFRLTDVSPDASFDLYVVDDRFERGVGAHVTAGEHRTDDLVVQLSPMSRVSGRVVDDRGEAQAGVLVFLYERQGQGVHEREALRTDPRGRYEFRVVPGMEVCTRAGGDDDSRMSVPIKTAAGVRHALPDIVYRPWCMTTVSGRVTDRAGSTIPEARVALWIDQDRWTTTANVRGEFRFDRVPAKGEFVSVSAADPDGRCKGRATVNLTQSRTQLTVALGEATDAFGRVMDERGQPVSDASVRVFVRIDEHGHGNVHRTTTDRQGTYRVCRLMSGCQAIATVSAQGYGRARSQSRMLTSGRAQSLGELVLPRPEVERVSPGQPGARR